MNRVGRVSCGVLLILLLGCPSPSEGPADNFNPVGFGDFERFRVTENVSYVLLDGEAHHRAYPSSFKIPPKAERHSLKNDQIVKLMFRISFGNEIETERMWVIVKGREDDEYIGILDNDPYCTDEMKSGIEVRFLPKHIIQIYEED